MLHDMSFVQRRSEDTRKYILFCSPGSASGRLITIAVAHVSWRGWIAACARCCAAMA